MGVKNAAKLQKTSINQFAVKALTEAVTRTARASSFVVHEPSIEYSGKKPIANAKHKQKKTKQ